MGSEETKAIIETAKAAQEIAKTTGKTIDAAQSLGEFVGKFIGGPLTQASGIVEDKLKYLRWERQVRLMQRSQQFLREMGLEVPSRRIPLNVAIPLLQAASMEEDDELQDIWAKLLVNAANANSGVEVTRSLISILENFGPLEAKVLQAIFDAPADVCPDGIVATTNLPSSYLNSGNNNAIPDLPSESVQLALWNLKRLGCIDSAGMWDSGIENVRITSLGRALVRACTVNG